MSDRKPRRPDNGFQAWQATLGYICQHHSPDAVLKLRLEPTEDGNAAWSASLTWGSKEEAVASRVTLADALGDLWQEVERHHDIFLSEADALRCPKGYSDLEWLDVNTQDVLHRFIWTTKSVFENDWLILIVYHPTEAPTMRVQVRLLAKSKSRWVGGRGPSLLEATRDAFRKAVPVFVSQKNNAQTSIDEPSKE